MLLKRPILEPRKSLCVPGADYHRRTLTQHRMCNFSLFGGDIITAQLACQRDLIAFLEHLVRWFAGTFRGRTPNLHHAVHRDGYKQQHQVEQ